MNAKNLLHSYLHVKWIFAIHFTKIIAPVVFSSLYKETTYQILQLSFHLQNILWCRILSCNTV